MANERKLSEKRAIAEMLDCKAGRMLMDDLRNNVPQPLGFTDVNKCVHEAGRGKGWTDAIEFIKSYSDMEVSSTDAEN